jgi:thioredoxin 1
MSATLVADKDTFETTLDTSKPTLVYFWATWCQSCKLMSPQIEKLAQENADKYSVVKVEIGANPELAEKFEIMSTPTMLLFKPGVTKPKEVQVGYAAKDWVAEIVEKYL